ncbi:MAG: hypothetical protein H6631_11495 [Anaerolineaceae bacterium]|nr:hypothetical protein [Anaerolineaceae bacterium]MCB9102593.1 hypothetical protein [Anaerolineales bacterium]
MTVATINIQLDDDAAQIYTTASEEDRKKIQLLLSFWLREFDLPSIPLTDLMDEISEKAQQRGLTPEILETLLDAD